MTLILHHPGTILQEMRRMLANSGSPSSIWLHCGARLPMVKSWHATYIFLRASPDSTPKTRLRNLAVCLWHAGKDRCPWLHSSILFDQLISHFKWSFFHLKSMKSSICLCKHASSHQDKKNPLEDLPGSSTPIRSANQIADESGIQPFLRILPNGWTYDWVRIHGSL